MISFLSCFSWYTMKALSNLISGVLFASTAIAPAMATPQLQEGRVYVGPIGASQRVSVSIMEAKSLCQQRGCWVTDGIEVTPGNWVPNTHFPVSKPIREPGTGYGLLEVQPSR